MSCTVNLTRTYSAPIYYPMFQKQKKGKESCFQFASLYGRFLSINIAKTIATTMMRTNKPAIAGMKYRSAIDFSATGLGLAVGAAGSTANDVSA